ncbi:nucleotidyltransferase family protein [Pontimicrobium aquaticum]|uniref:Nucleotidyltransferase family protein n=1 Tax=Pontimicrobium aquaticum TaxID=2565367 RepID=A0A4V6WE96_9FLAO|nr:nucleotidyltransferase family protein [Pontimicrobium aquaticum]TJY34659.1 nucleotidyltransferase family protein [Pontimicrobium aquaticum]
MNATKNIATLIMAAGSSSRMGQPKQLLPWNNTTLIENAITNALQLDTSKTIVVLGANSEQIISKIESYPIEIIHNPNWEKGLGNSIAFGVNHIKNNNPIDGVLVVLADQPLIHSSYLKEVVSVFNANKHQIIATKYPNGKSGVPALFDTFYLEELSIIDGDKGAKAILEKYADSVITIQLDTSILDVDTEEDYNKLKSLRGATRTLKL